MRGTASALFRATFGVAPRAAASAPGRVNLIGEHTDYNGGPVLPVALAARTTVAVGPAEAGVLEVVSTRDGRLERVDYKEGRPAGWGAYVAGVMRELLAAGAAPPGGGARAAPDRGRGVPRRARSRRCALRHHGPDDRRPRATAARAVPRMRVDRHASDPVAGALAARGHRGATPPRGRCPQPAARRVRGGGRPAPARAAGARVARELAGLMAAAPQAGAPRAAALARPARRGGDRAHPLRRAAPRQRAPDALRDVAVRVARVLPPPVRVQCARTGSRGGGGAARRRAGRASHRRGLGRRGARTAGEGGRGTREERSEGGARNPARVRGGVRARAVDHGREARGRRAAGVGPVRRARPARRRAMLSQPGWRNR